MRASEKAAEMERKCVNGIEINICYMVCGRRRRAHLFVHNETVIYIIYAVQWPISAVCQLSIGERITFVAVCWFPLTANIINTKTGKQARQNKNRIKKNLCVRVLFCCFNDNMNDTRKIIHYMPICVPQ